MIIRLLRDSDLEPISQLHKRAFDETHFTSLFPVEKLIEYFRALLLKNKYCFTAVDENNKYAGYIVAGSNTGDSVAEFSKNNYLFVLKMFLTHPGFILEKLTLFIDKLSSKSAEEIPKLNVYIIAVDPALKKGVGKLLLEYFEKEILQDGYSSYSLSVRNHNHKAIDFYLRNGFQKISCNKSSSQYIKKIWNS